MRLIWLALGVALATGSVRAHDLVVWAEIVDGTLVVEAYLSDGAVSRNAAVLVQSQDGQVLIEGRTDAAGRMAVPIPGDLPLVIHVDDHGHAAAVALTADGLQPHHDHP